MKPRQDLVEIFSTFLRWDADRVTGWLWDPRLRRRMTAFQAAQAAQDPDFWALQWHRLWRERDAVANGSLPVTPAEAEAHLSAYLQETGYWAARKMAQNQRQLAEVADFFQVAMARVPKLLKYFQPERSASLRKFAELVFENSLKDWLREQRQVAVCTDWALLYRLSRKRLGAALVGAGWSPQQMAPAILAWECWQEQVALDPRALNTLGDPSGPTWQAIAAAYNAERLGQIGATPTLSPEQLAQLLLNCAKLVRRFLKPEVVSADAPPAGLDAGSRLDTLADPQAMPMEMLLQQEAEATRTQQLAQFQDALAAALATVEAAEIALLRCYYGDQLTQADIAQQLDLKQYQVSRRLERVRQALLKQLAQWSQATLHIAPTPAVVDAMNQPLEEWLRAQFQGEVEG
jgi:RNA polymerase sigma factor (sigma-70 family)